MWAKYFEVYLTHLVAFLDVLVSHINIWQVLSITGINGKLNENLSIKHVF
jgi:hypothetical protein